MEETNTTISIFEKIQTDSCDTEAAIATVLAGVQVNGLTDRSSFVKTKFFNSQDVSGNDPARSNLSPKDMWLKYVEIQPLVLFKKVKDEVVNAMKQVGGIQYTVKHSSLLAYYIDYKHHPIEFNTWKVMVEVSVQSPDCIANQRAESCTVVCAHYQSRSNYSKGFVTVGVKKSKSLFHTAVSCKNLPALEHLLQLSEQLGTDSQCLKPTERTLYYKLKGTSMKEDAVINMGGANFCGAQKFTTVFPSLPSAQTNDAAPKPALKRQKTFAAELKDDSELPDVPKWSEIECEWELCDPPGELIDSSPLELAFQQGNWEAWEALTASTVVQAQQTELRLVGKLDRALPTSLSRLVNLTSLTLKLQIETATPVPAVVFDLPQLRTLILANCNFNELPENIAQLEHLEVLNVANMPLKTLPILQLGKLKKLTSVDCSGIKLASPPSEIVQHGPEAVARYICDLGEGAARNHDVLLMFIGDGEAGKTSTLRALKNIETNVAGSINVDDRTIGIDISSFQPDPARPLKFFAWDFGGQGIYAIMQQLFVSRRALYPLLWRVRQSLNVNHLDRSVKCDVCRKCLTASAGDKQQPIYRVKGQGLCHAACVSYEPLITSWTERLQFRVPGVPIVLIATHIDCATPEEVDEQCAAVEEVVQRLQARQVQTSAAIPPLRIHNNGRSLRVNNMNGDGVAVLRKELCEIAESLDFYGEVIPSSYVRLREKLRSMQLRDEPSWCTWLHWGTYATLAAECGLTEPGTLAVATRFFHDVGELRYFGLKAQEEKAAPTIEYDSDGDVIEPAPYRRNRADSDWSDQSGDGNGDTEQKAQPNPAVAEDAIIALTQDTAELLAATVFPNPFWVVDVLRGLIRHDHGPLLEQIKNSALLSKREQKDLRRRVYRLMQRGILHESLLSYVWQGVAGLSADDTVNKDEFMRLIALMKAFDILMDKPGEQSQGVEWVVPALMAGKHAHTIEGDAFVDDSLPYVCRVVYDALPPYFDMILIAHIMNARIADSVDFIKGAAAFKKLAERALLFAGQGKVRDPCSVFRSDQAASHPMRTVLRPDQCHVVIAASSRDIMQKLLDEVTHLEKFFPGLCRLCTLFPCYSCRMEKQAFCQSTEAGAVDARAVLAETEAETQALLVALQPYLSTTSLACSALYVKHKPQFVQLMKNYADIKALFDAEIAEQDFELTFAPQCKFPQYYSYSEAKEHPLRFYQEVYKFMHEIVAIFYPSVEASRDGEPYARVAACQSAVAERQFQIAFLQAGAELPTLRSINKFCARHLDVLFTAWELCPELEILCMSLNRALQEDKSLEPALSIHLAIESLSRADAAPEYMHLLRATVEIMTSARPQTPLKAQVAWLEAYKELLSSRRDDITLLAVQHPELRTVQDSTGVVADKVAFLAEVYKAGTTLYQQEHHAVLTAVLQEIDAAMATQEPEEGLTEALQRHIAFVEAHRFCLGSLPSETLLCERRTSVGGFLEWHWDFPESEPVHARIVENFSRNERLLEQGLLQLHVFTEQLEHAVIITLQSHIAQVVAQIADLDPTFVRNNFATVKEAALGYFNAHAKYLHAASRVFSQFADNSDGSFTRMWKRLFPNTRDGGKEDADKTHLIFADLLAEAECAEKVLCFAQLVQKIDTYLRANPTAQEKFDSEFSDAHVRTDPAKVKEYFQMHAALLSAVQAVPSEFVCHFDLPDETFLREFLCADVELSERVSFSTPGAALACMTRVVDTVVSTAQIEEYPHQAAVTHAWEKEFPITVVYDREDPYNVEILKEREQPWSIAITTTAFSLDLGVKLIDVAEKLKNDYDYTHFSMEIYRTLSYLADGKDVSLLSEIVDTRLKHLFIMRKMTAMVATLSWPFKRELEDNKQREKGLYFEIAQSIGESMFKDRTHAHEDLLKNMRKVLEKVVKEADLHLSDALLVLCHRESAVAAASGLIQTHIDAAVSRSHAHKDHAVLSLAQLRAEGRLEPVLRDLVMQSKQGLKVYGDFVQSERDLETHRVVTVVNEAHQRAARYRSVQQARMRHGPVWYFGGAENSTYRSSKLSSEFELTRWNEDLSLFANAGDAEVTIHCPASFGLTVHSIAQPNMLDDVLILCTAETQILAEQIGRAGDYTTLCTGSSSDQIKRKARPVWIKVQKETLVDKMPGVKFPDSVCGLRIGKSFVTEVEGKLLCCDFDFGPETYSFHPHDALMYQFRAERTTSVVVQCASCVVEGSVSNRQFLPNPERFLYVQLPGEAESRYVTEEEVIVPHCDDARLLAAWKGNISYNFGGSVCVEVSPGVTAVAEICVPPVEVVRRDGSIYGAVSCDRITLYTKLQLENTKAVICLVDPYAAQNEQFQEDLQRAHDLELGIIPVICTGYEITDFQSWWPETLPSLRYHSLFVDARFCDEERLPEFCESYIKPTLRVMLNEYKPRMRKIPTIEASHSPILTRANTVYAPSRTVEPTETAAAHVYSGPQYVYCEQCAADGSSSTKQRRGALKGDTNVAAAGSFDRWRCQDLVGEWTMQELRRREEHPDQPAVFSCSSTICCTGDVPHERLVRDVLSVQEKKTCYACPSCVSRGMLPPHCFDRDACLAELEQNQSASILCPRCGEFIPQYELLACEVFLSYCWGAPECPACTETASVWESKRLRRGYCEDCHQAWSAGECRYTTQRLVCELKGNINDEAGVMCWQDVDRLVGGKDLEREMEVGVQKADVIVIFLDDGYVRSANCRKEYLYSTKHGKYIIPVLLQGYSACANAVANGAADSESVPWWPESMASLSQFEPIVLNEASQMEHAMQLICERIQSRFHRAQRYATADDAVAYLRDYSSWGATRRAFLSEKLSLEKQEELDAFVAKTFQSVDRDGDNSIDDAELAAFLDQHNLSLSKEQIAMLMMEADLDNNGLLSLEELKMVIYAMLDERDRHNAVE